MCLSGPFLVYEAMFSSQSLEILDSLPYVINHSALWAAFCTPATWHWGVAPAPVMPVLVVSVGLPLPPLEAPTALVVKV